MKKFIIISLDQVQQNPYQPRKIFHEAELRELALSIQSTGIIHPPTVRPIENSDQYELISGERRVKAAKLAGLTQIPVILSLYNEIQAAQAAVIENIQRVDLNPIELAQALKKLMQEFGLTQEELSKTLGKKRATIANILRLLSLPDMIKKSLLQEFITLGHAKVILSLNEEDKQLLLHELILRDHLNVRETEKTAKKLSLKSTAYKTSPLKNKNIYLEELREDLQRYLGTKVNIYGDDQKGNITIEYHSLDNLTYILEKFSYQSNTL